MSFNRSKNPYYCFFDSSKQYFHERPCMVVTIALMAPSCFATHFAKYISIYQLDT